MDLDNEAWMIWSYNEADAAFGYDPGAVNYMDNLPKAIAKSIARHLNKVSPWFVRYYADREPIRLV